MTVHFYIYYTLINWQTWVNPGLLYSNWKKKKRTGNHWGFGKVYVLFLWLLWLLWCDNPEFPVRMWRDGMVTVSVGRWLVWAGQGSAMGADWGQLWRGLGTVNTCTQSCPDLEGWWDMKTSHWRKSWIWKGCFNR